MSDVMHHNTNQTERISPPTVSLDMDRWSKVFMSHGEVWGKSVSPANEILIKHIEEMRDRLIKAGEFRPEIKVLEAGYGYGRDMKALLEIRRVNAKVTGMDSSPVGQQLAFFNTNNVPRGSERWALHGDFTSKALPLQKENFDFFLSHRVMHLLGTNGKVRAFLENAYDMLKPGGMAVVSARDERDYKEDKMFRKPDNTVAYKDRPDHVITLWNTKDLVSIFEKYGFSVQEAVQSQETESTLHPDETSYFTIIRAKKPVNTP